MVVLLLSWDVVNCTRCFCIIPCFLHFNHVCTFLCAGSYTTYFVFSLSLSKTCCKVALNNLVLQKRKWMCQPDCIKLCLGNTQLQNHGGFTGKGVCGSYHVLRTESQWFCTPWCLGTWADRASSSCASVNALIVGKELDSHYFLLEVTFCSHCTGQIKSHGHGAPPRVELRCEILLCAERQRPRNMWDINTVYHTEAQRC